MKKSRNIIQKGKRKDSMRKKKETDPLPKSSEEVKNEENEEKDSNGYQRKA